MERLSLKPTLTDFGETVNMVTSAADRLSLAVDNFLSDKCPWCHGAKGSYHNGDEWVDCTYCIGSGFRPTRKPEILYKDSFVTLSTWNAGSEKVQVDDGVRTIWISREGFIEAARKLMHEQEIPAIIQAVQLGGA